MASSWLNHSVGRLKRRLPIGAEAGVEGRVHFRVWAPLRKEVRVVLETGPDSPAIIGLEPDPEEDGYYSAFCA
jgi:maltooligosyltrehalose trehalohydrolase